MTVRSNQGQICECTRPERVIIEGGTEDVAAVAENPSDAASAMIMINPLVVHSQSPCAVSMSCICGKVRLYRVLRLSRRRTAGATFLERPWFTRLKHSLHQECRPWGPDGWRWKSSSGFSVWHLAHVFVVLML